MDVDGRLTSRELCDLYLIVGQCSGLGADPVAWRACMLEKVVQLLHGDAALYVHAELELSARPPTNVQLHALLRHSWPEVVGMRRLHSCLPHNGDPFPSQSLIQEACSIARRDAAPFTALRQDLTTKAAWHRSRVYEDYFQPARLDEWLLALHWSHGQQLRAVVVARTVGCAPFNNREQKLLDTLFRECTSRIGTTLSDEDAFSVSDLSQRTIQILSGLLEGDSEKQLAHRLKISPSTVHSYVRRLYSKFNVCSRAELMSRCRPYSSILATLHPLRKPDRN